RVMDEELQGLGYQWVRYDWHAPEADALSPLIKGRRVAFDLPAVAAEYKRDSGTTTLDFADVYFPLTKGEVKKYHWLGRKTSEVLEKVADVVRPGMTERDVQYLLQRELWYWDIYPTVVLSAVDDRFKTYRHPVVVGATLDRMVALNVCTRRWGLVISTTRVLHFGEPEPSLGKAWENGAKVAAAMWASTRPGKTLGDVVAAAQKGYREIGFPDEWKLHHQGGPILTLERLFLVTPGDRTPVRPGMTLAWNPTVQGAKFEDTILVKDDGTVENLSAPINWPTVSVTLDGQTFKIPTLKVVPPPASDH
ncbi:MAG TPA: M24 family metallopeptidase, partial [Armatimonadota bacterium]|nr:M24 family metallopeptidase [Armatimonadota bacterium]